jgi:hypothetical protein
MKCHERILTLLSNIIDPWGGWEKVKHIGLRHIGIDYSYELVHYCWTIGTKNTLAY